MKRMMWISLLVLEIITICIIGPACNTIRGAGQDIKETGEAIEETAEDVGD